MFNTMDVARRIRTARNRKNMTQMALADEMGVSFQAVSNWERGNSLPDIGKLPDLCRVLGVSIQDILGEEKETETVVQLVENQTVELERLAGIAPMVSPEQIESACRKAREGGGKISLKSIIPLAPFLDQEFLGEIAEQAAADHPEDLVDIAPFLKNETLDLLAKRLDGADDKTLIALAPFLSDAALKEITEKCGIEDTEKLIALAPFLGEETLIPLVKRMTENGGCSLDQMMGFAPFLSKQTLRSLAEKEIRGRDF